MATFRQKPKKTTKSNNSKNVTTLDTEHNKFISNIYNDKQTIEQKQLLLNSLQTQLDELINLQPDLITHEIQCTKNKLRDKINTIQQEIIDIENNTSEIDYYYKTADIIINYYNNDSNTQNDNQQSVKNMLDIFNKKKVVKNNKANLFDIYKSATDDAYSSKQKKYNLVKLCEQCGNEKIINYTDGLIQCIECGLCDIVVIESDKPNYKENIPDNSNSAYRRINHLNEILSQIQAKESTDIPQYVFESINSELNKRRINNITTIDYYTVQDILKTLRLAKYYEHIPNIINHLTGLPPPTMTREIEEKLRSMFNSMQQPFLKFCPPDRENFISYYFVIYKCCELLELDQFLSCFKLPKGREVIKDHDNIWKNICKELEWEFIPTI